MTVYFFQVGTDGPIKIGQTSKEVNMRLNCIRSSIPFPVHLLGVIEDAPLGLEKELHDRFHALHIQGEWFHPDDALTAFITESATTPRRAVSFHFTSTQLAMLEEWSEREGVSVEKLIQRAIRELLDAEPLSPASP